MLTVRCSRCVAQGALLTVRRSRCVAHGACVRRSRSVAHGALLTVRHSRCVAHGASLTVRRSQCVAHRRRWPIGALLTVRCSRCVVCRGHRDLRVHTQRSQRVRVLCSGEFELTHTTVARGGSRRSQRAAGRASAARWLRRQRRYTRPRPRRTWRSCSTSTCMLTEHDARTKPLHALHVAPCATKASARARAATSTSTRRPRERMCRTPVAVPSSGSAATTQKKQSRSFPSAFCRDMKTACFRKGLSNPV